MSQYERLEAEMVSYSNLTSVPVIDNKESLVVIRNSDMPNGYQPSMSDMTSLLQDRILIRQTVYNKLKQAQKALEKQDKDFSLYITYGYRSLEIQTKKFLEQLKIISGERFFENSIDLYEEVHRFIAVPTVAGHPTGGAVDLTIINLANNQFLDFGSRLYDLSNKDCYTFSPNISRRGKRNRSLLRSCMLKAGFAPFDGEWWHFSYGDREWAYYYKKPNAIYDQLPERKVKDLVI